MGLRNFIHHSLAIALLLGLGFGAEIGISRANSFVPTRFRSTRILFHAGERKFLDEDIAAGTIPQSVWDEFIFGKTSFDLPEYRKGLYGAEALWNTDLYASYKIYEGKAPWVMMIRLKPECMTDDHLFEGYYQAKADDASEKLGSFNSWYHAHEKAIPDPVKKACVLESKGWTYWSEGIPYDRYAHSAQELAESDLCTGVIEQFMHDTDFKVFADNFNNSSWYIRDRSCIESIEGRPDELFRAFAENKIGNSFYNLLFNLLGDLPTPGASPTGGLYIGLRVLSETALLNTENKVLLSAILRGLRDVSEKEIRAQAMKVAFDDSAGAELILAAGYRAAARAVARGRASEFQRELRLTLDDLIEDHGKACHGKNGVPQEYWDSCLKVSLHYGQRLMRLFGR